MVEWAFSRTLTAAGVGLLAVLCIALGSSAPATAQLFGRHTQPTPAAAAPVPYDYVLGAGDVLRVIVYGEESLTGPFTVAGDGTVSFPLIGDVQAAGKTVEQVRDEITAGLKTATSRTRKSASRF